MKTFAIALCLVLCVTLCACNKDLSKADDELSTTYKMAERLVSAMENQDFISIADMYLSNLTQDDINKNQWIWERIQLESLSLDMVFEDENNAVYRHTFNLIKDLEYPRYGAPGEHTAYLCFKNVAGIWFYNPYPQKDENVVLTKESVDRLKEDAQQFIISWLAAVGSDISDVPVDSATIRAYSYNDVSIIFQLDAELWIEAGYTRENENAEWIVIPAPAIHDPNRWNQNRWDE